MGSSGVTLVLFVLWLWGCFKGNVVTVSGGFHGLVDLCN